MALTAFPGECDLYYVVRMLFGSLSTEEGADVFR